MFAVLLNMCLLIKTNDCVVNQIKDDVLRHNTGAWTVVSNFMIPPQVNLDTFTLAVPVNCHNSESSLSRLQIRQNGNGITTRWTIAFWLAGNGLLARNYTFNPSGSPLTFYTSALPCLMHLTRGLLRKMTSNKEDSKGRCIHFSVISLRYLSMLTSISHIVGC